MSRFKVSKFHTCLYGICLLSLIMEYIPSTRNQAVHLEPKQHIALDLNAQDRTILFYTEENSRAQP